MSIYRVDARWTTKPVTEIFSRQEIHHAIMAGQIAPKNLFDLRPGLESADSCSRNSNSATPNPSSQQSRMSFQK
jgi:hypothetical protein